MTALLQTFIHEASTTNISDGTAEFTRKGRILTKKKKKKKCSLREMHDLFDCLNEGHDVLNEDEDSIDVIIQRIQRKCFQKYETMIHIRKFFDCVDMHENENSRVDMLLRGCECIGLKRWVESI